VVAHRKSKQIVQLPTIVRTASAVLGGLCTKPGFTDGYEALFERTFNPVSGG